MVEKNHLNLMKVYTKTGDKGETSLLGGERVKKNSIRVKAYGAVDEANSFLGQIRSKLKKEEMKNIIYSIQKKFFILGAQLACDKKNELRLKERITLQDVKEIEDIIDVYSEKTLKTFKFVVPGEGELSSLFHITRTIIRRAEREIVELNEFEGVPKEILLYINRLSDLLYTFSLVVEGEEKVENISKEVMKRLKISKNILNLEVAKEIIKKGEEKAKELGKDFSFCILNSDGNIIIQEKMDNSILVSLEISKKKAYTSVALRMETEKLKDLIQPGKEFYTLQNSENIVAFSGGIPLFYENNLLGAIGVSGGSIEEDTLVAKECEKIFYEIGGQREWK